MKHPGVVGTFIGGRMNRLDMIRRDYENFTTNRTHAPPLIYAMRFANDIRLLLEVADAFTHFFHKNKWSSTLNVECEESWDRICKAMSKLEEDVQTRRGRAMEWISVKDRLPESGKAVLTYSPAFHILIASCVNNDARIWRWWFELREVRESITHWMPLPEPPKLGGREMKKTTPEELDGWIKSGVDDDGRPVVCVTDEKLGGKMTKLEAIKKRLLNGYREDIYGHQIGEIANNDIALLLRVVEAAKTYNDVIGPPIRWWNDASKNASAVLNEELAKLDEDE